MVIKAKSSRVESKVYQIEKPETRGEPSDYVVGGMDGLVMVVFPQSTWNTVQEMAATRNVSSAEILSVAIELLKESIERGDDGTRGR